MFIKLGIECDMLNVIFLPMVSILSDFFLGLCIIDSLKIERLNSYLKILLSFYLSFFLKAVIYYLTQFSNSFYLIKYYFCGLAFGGLVYFAFFTYKKIQLKKGFDYFFPIELASIFCLFLLMTVFNYNGIFDYQDFIWHMGNINILSSVSFHDCRLHEVIFTYHYFSDLYLAFYKVLLNFDARYIVLFFPCIIYPLLYVLTIEGIAEHYARICNKNISRLLVLLSLTSVTLVEGNRLLNTMWLHSLTNVNGMSFTFPLVYLLIVFVGKSFEKKSFLTCCMISILMIVLTGSKGPVAIVIYAALILSLLYNIYHNHSYIKVTKDIQLVICSTVSFILVYINLLRYGASDGSTAIRVNRIFEVVTDCEYFRQIVIKLSAIIPPLLAKSLLVFPHFFLTTGILGALSVTIFCFLVVKKKNVDLYSIFLIISVVLGTGGAYFVAHDGKSQMYFLFGCFPVFAVFIISNLNVLNNDKSWKKYVTIVAVVLLLPTARVILNNIRTQHLSYSFSFNRIGVSRYLSSEELDGLLFVKDNIPKNAVLATNRHYMEKNKHIKASRYFYDSAYSDRQYWIEGYYYAKNSGFDVTKGPDLCKYNDTLFDSAIEESKRVKQAKEMNVKYLVVHKDFSNLKIKDTSLFKVLFENSKISIVEVL